MLDYIAPNPLSLSAIISFAIITKALFRKIIRQKPILDHIIALSFFIFCNAIGTTLIILKEPSLAPPFYWLGLIGIFLYFAIRPFKKSDAVIEKQTQEAENKHEEHGLKEEFLPSKEWLIDKIPQEDILGGVIYACIPNYGVTKLDGTPTQKRKNPRHEIFPSSKTASAEWIKFQENIQPDDEVWTFSSAKTQTRSPFHRMGICLIRDGEIVDTITEEAHFLYRKL